MKRKPFILYHWSPRERRDDIIRRGLRVGMPAVAHSQSYRYLCWSDSPSLAWALSAVALDKEGEYDLWMCWSDRLGRLTRRNDLPNYPVVTEYRSFQNVKKRDLWLVGTRMYKRRKR